MSVYLNSRLMDNKDIFPSNESPNSIEYENGLNQIDGELKRLLIDEKSRNDQLKKYYETLKADYGRSQSEVLELQTQLKNLIEENKIMQEKYKSMLEKMQQELKKKQLNIEDLKAKELDDLKLEKLKEELSQQIEMPYKDIVKQFEQELEKLHDDCNKLRYENSYLKGSNEHEKNEFQALTQQYKMKHDIELNAIRKDRDVMRQKLQEINHSEAHKLREILKENNQFKVKVKALMEENDELRVRIERIDSHQSSLMRNHSKSITEIMSKISLLESEKESMKAQNDTLHKELTGLNETIANDTRKIHDLERENIVLKNYIDEAKHNHKKELSNLKLDLVKEKGEHNRTKEVLLNRIEDLNTKYEICEGNLQTQKLLVEEKEREVSKNVNAVHEENWVKISELTNEKLDLESKLQMLQKDLDFKASIMQADKDKSDEKLRLLEKQRDDIYRENNRLKTLINETENINSLLEREQEKNHELTKKIHKLETELATNSNLDHELTEMNLKLKNDLTYYVQDSQKAKEHLQRMKDEFENRLADMKAQYIGEKSEYQLKCDDLQSKLRKSNTQMTETKLFYEKKKAQHQRHMKQIKSKSELIHARLNELKIREQAVKNYVPLEIHNRVKQKLYDILKRHQDFRSMLSTNWQGNFLANNSPTEFLKSYIIESQVQETPQKNNKKIVIPSKHEIDQLTTRLDELAQKQSDHLSNLIEESSIKSRKLDFSNSINTLSIHEKSHSDSHVNSKAKLNLSGFDSDHSDTKNNDRTNQAGAEQNTKDKQQSRLIRARKLDNADDDDSSSESYDDDFDTLTNQK